MKRINLTALIAIAIWGISLPLPAAPARRATVASPPHAIVSADGMLLGAGGQGRWLPDDWTAERLRGGEPYRFYGFRHRLGSAPGGRAKYDAHEGAWSVEFPTKALDDAVVAMIAPWNALPRLPKDQCVSQPLYHKIVRDFLVTRGMHDPQVNITRIIRCDLDGKGTDTVLISARKANHGSGDYSVILARQLVGRTVRTVVLEESLNNRNERPLDYDLVGLYDFQGDGRMEPVVALHEIDAGGLEIFDVRAGRARRALIAEAGV